MPEIPPTKNTDAEDVVWGLQTAETLWKRGERIDALVWLRRAAQAAGDANDDDRALELARHAAELTEWVASEKRATSDIPIDDETPIEIDDAPTFPAVAPTAVPPAATSLPAPRPPVPRTASQPMVRTAEPPVAGIVTIPSGAALDDEGRPSATSVLPAERVHAGLFDPWADPRLAVANAPPAPRTTVVDTDEEEVITSVRPAALSRPESSFEAPLVARVPPEAPPVVREPPRSPAGTKPPTPPKPPPPLPPRARPQAPKPPVVAEPESLPEVEPEEAEETSDAKSVTDVVPPMVSAEAHVAPTAEPEPSPPVVEQAAAPVPPPPTAKLDLDTVDAFADLPDDARAAFAAAATLHSLAEGEEIGAFALAYVLSGAFDVAATVVDAPAVRLAEGAVLRARGTTDENVPIRLICANGKGVIATWSDHAVEEAFRTIPWVEEDLRGAADRVQTLVGITIGPLGERLDASIREEIVGRLTMRPLIAGEVVVKEGEPVPGLLLIGIGELELVKGDNVVGAVSSGDFLFATEVLGAGSAPSTARAGAGGALVMFGDRRIAQELLVTCPPLLELFAGM
jgi:hypothetical protein